ncbi:O-methyltransferase 2 [Amborella trichopoda]|nr:O-methyltransferase 2 [Amborella trichopoda]|eukprot:XP_006841695.3 O-methyltransferase 2 [Amborella trichopoda]
MLTMLNHPIFLAPWHCFSRCVVERVDAFEKAHGSKLWMYTANNTGANDIFNEAMASDTVVVLEALLSEYKSGFAGLTSLVDVAGGTGTAVSAIVKAHPHISRINFDLPQVVSSAPEHPGVVHVSGDMFISIPHADAVFMKWILHDWNDEDCVKILKQCRKALPSKSGKLIIVDVVLHLKEDTSAFADSRLAFDMLMFAVTSGGLERTEEEWRALLSKGGFSNCNIKPLPTLQSIIEAYPDPNE